MKIQEASEEVTEEGVLFPCSKTSYIKANTRKGKGTDDFSTDDTHMRPDGGARRP
jgi:hypothetical protein